MRKQFPQVLETLSSYWKSFSKNRVFTVTVQILSLLVAFVLLNRYLRFFYFEEILSYTDAGAFFSQSILLTNLNKAGFFVPLVVLVIPAFFFWRSLRWKHIDIPYARTIVLLYSSILTWILTTYQFNYLFGHWHWPDRLFVFICWILIGVHPLFTLPFLIGSYSILAQFNYGPGAAVTIFYDPTFFFLTLFFAYLLLKIVKDIKPRVFLVTALALKASCYFVTGFTKATLGEHPLQWALTAKIYLGFSWVKYTGWHWFTGKLLGEELFWFLSTFNRPMAIFVFLLELAALLLIFNKRIALVLLLLFSSFHFFTFVFVGISFWTWALENFILFGWILALDENFADNLFALQNVPGFLLVVTLVVSLGAIPSNIGWWSVRSHYAFELSVTNDRGRTFQVGQSIFAPFHRKFSFLLTQDYIIDRVILPSVVFDYPTAKAINQTLRTKKDFHRLKKRFGINRYDPKGARFFDRIVKKFFRNYAKLSSVRQGYFYHFTKWTHAPVMVFYYQKPWAIQRDEIPGKIENVRVSLKQGFFNGSRNVTVQKNSLRKITIEH